MATKKIKANEATLDDLKQSSTQGITTKIYQIMMYVPVGWVEEPQENLRIYGTSINNEIFKNIVMYSSFCTIEKVNKTNILLNIEVIDSYLNLLYDMLRKLPNEAEIKLSA